MQDHSQTTWPLESIIMNKPRIITDPNIMMGKPVIAGTRLTVELIIEKLAAGESVQQILNSYPRLTRASITAAIRYARRNHY